MSNDVQKPLEDGSGAPRGGRAGGSSGFFSVRSLSNCMRIVSSGASNVVSTVRSTGASFVSSVAADRHDDPGRDHVLWAGFDKLECEGNLPREVLLLGYRSGFQVWDVEQADDVKQLESRRDGFASFLQMEKKLIASKKNKDKFAGVRPLLVVAGDGSATVNGTNYDGPCSPCNEVGSCQELGTDNSLPTHVGFYSLKTHNYVHVLKFRSAVLSIRCSPRVIAVSQASQIYLHDAATLERQYSILTYPLVLALPGSGCIGYGPLALGVRWLAYSGNPEAISGSTRVSPQDLGRTTATLVHPNGGLMAYYAKESSKQLAAGLVTLGDIGRKKLSKYYSELMADSSSSTKNENSNFKTNGTNNVQPADGDNAGMVIVRDVVSKSVIVQFRAHSSPISALCFDPSGTLLVTASIHGHSINVFHIMPSPHKYAGGSGVKGTCLHLYRLQRGITNAVIQDISFSEDSRCILISSSRGTSHLFAISSFGGAAATSTFESNFANICCGPNSASKLSLGLSHSSCALNLCQQSETSSGYPVILSAVSRIKNVNTGLKGAVTGAAAAATGKISPFSVATASTFHNCNSSGLTVETSSARTKYYLLVFSSTGSIIQYVLHKSSMEDSDTDVSGLGTISPGLPQETDARLVVEALQKWDVCYKQNRRDRIDNVDIYGDHGNGDGARLLQKGLKKGTSTYPADTGKDLKVKNTAEQTCHCYISKIELHTHEARASLWENSKICFQLMLDENVKICNIISGEGEIEIERIPTRTIEAKSKYLIPLFDSLQQPKFQQARTNTSNMERKESLSRQRSGASEYGMISRRSSHSSLECMIKNTVTAEGPNSINDNSWSHHPHEADDGFVNNSIDSQNNKSPLQVVNSSKGFKTEAQLEFVNNVENEMMDTLFD